MAVSLHACDGALPVEHGDLPCLEWGARARAECEANCEGGSQAQAQVQMCNADCFEAGFECIEPLNEDAACLVCESDMQSCLWDCSEDN